MENLSSSSCWGGFYRVTIRVKMGQGFPILILWMFNYLLAVSGNAESHALMAFKFSLSDPNNILTNWDAADLFDPCTWFNVTCNNNNSVTRIDLGNAKLSGQLVPQLGSLSNLQYLALYSNNISGSIPPELGNLTSLVSLELYQNKLTGPIPDELGKLSKLQFLRLGNNTLSGTIPMSLTTIDTLQSLELYSNNISGRIPPELGNLTSLVSLDLSQNILHGPIPDELGKLRTMRFLCLYNNALSGTIPMSLTTISALQILDLSFNNLSGYIPVNGSFSLFTPENFEDNPKLNNSSYLGPRISSSSQPTTVMTLDRVDIRYIVVAVAATVLFAACTAAFVWRRRRKDQNHFFDVSAEDDLEFNSGALYWFSPRALYNFTLGELQVATDNFDPKNMVGKGGFGEVYKGCLADGSLVAVKRLKVVHNKVEELQFQTEVELISLVVHPNLLRLQGFCMTSTENLLVYPFMANGSVASCLQAGQGSQPLLDWPRRKQIALGSARGLAYLHHQFEPQVIHRDVKAANVLLDDKFEAVVGDFGLVKLMGFKDTHITTTVCGTIGHIAPEYFTSGECSEKTDVFGYGVMLLELLSGQKATDLAKLAIGDGFMLHEWVKGLLKDKKLERLVDANLQGDYIEEEVEQIIQVALLCTHTSPMQRPAMREVVRMLQGHGLAKRRWEELLKQEVLYRESFHALHPNSAWIVDSTSKIRPDELSGPR